MGGVLEKAPAFALKREQPYGGFLFNVQIQSFMSKSNEAQTAQVSGGAKATAEVYTEYKSSASITQEEYTTFSRLLDRNGIEHLIGCGYLFGKINYEFSDYFKSLPQAIMVLAQHAGDSEVIKTFINSLTAVNSALAAITEHRIQLSDLELLFTELERADIVYTVKH